MHFSFGHFHLRHGRQDAAVAEMRTAVAIYPHGASRAIADWLRYGGRTEDLPAIAGVSPTALYSLGRHFEHEKDQQRAVDAYVRACRTVGGDSDYRRPHERPAQDLLPALLAKLKRFGRDADYHYYARLWHKDLPQDETQ